jgi:hypothetical protein
VATDRSTTGPSPPRCRAVRRVDTVALYDLELVTRLMQKRPRRLRRMSVSLAVLATAIAASALLSTTRAAATTQPETTYFVTITLTDTKAVLSPLVTVKPGSLVVFNVRNIGAQARNLVFGADKTGFIASGKTTQFELNFLVPWRIRAISVERHGKHPLTMNFVCSY